MIHQSPYYLLDHPNNVWWVQIIQLFVIQCSALACYLVSLSPKCIFQQPILEDPQPVFLPQWDTKFHTHTEQRSKLQFCESLSFWIADWKTIHSVLNDNRHFLIAPWGHVGGSKGVAPVIHVCRFTCCRRAPGRAGPRIGVGCLENRKIFCFWR